MRIAFDVFGMVLSKGRGIGYYSVGLISEIMSRHPEDEYFLFNLADEDFHLPGGIPPGVRVTVFHRYFGRNGRLMLVKNAGEIVGNVIRRFIRDNRIDVFYLPSVIAGVPVTFKEGWFSGCRTVAVAYDVIPYLFPKQYLAKPGQYEAYVGKIDSFRWMDEIHAISQSVKEDLVSRLGFDPSRIRVIYAGVDKRFSEKMPSEEEERSLRARLGIVGKFMICTGGTDYRKNLPRLVTAYSLLPAELIAEYQLVIVCMLPKSQVDYFCALVKDNVVDGRVVFTGFVGDDDLAKLYNLSSLMVFPSLYEGFGLPVIEAWACGKPVVTSNNSSLGEIAGDAAITVDPSSEQDIAAGLRHALSECSLAEYSRRGKKRLAMFQWSRVADMAYAGLKALCADAGRIRPRMQDASAHLISASANDCGPTTPSGMPAIDDRGPTGNSSGHGFAPEVVSAMFAVLKRGDDFERTDGFGRFCETIAWAGGKLDSLGFSGLDNRSFADIACESIFDRPLTTREICDWSHDISTMPPQDFQRKFIAAMADRIKGVDLSSPGEDVSFLDLLLNKAYNNVFLKLPRPFRRFVRAHFKKDPCR